MFPFPKIFALGTMYIRDIFEGAVEITEKIDGSQFVFGMIDGKLQLRSKGAVLYVDVSRRDRLYCIYSRYTSC
jgi:hypothetical protein